MFDVSNAAVQFVHGWPLTAAVMVGLSMLKSFYDEWNDEASGRTGQAAVIVVASALIALSYFIGGTSLT